MRTDGIHTITFAVPPEMKEDLTALAKAEDRKLSQFIRKVLRERIAASIAQRIEARAGGELAAEETSSAAAVRSA